MSEPRYAVGIDLGTTHCVLSYVDLETSDRDEVDQAVFGIPQLTGPGAVEERLALPSFLYIAHADELTPADRSLPWDPQPPFVVGELARSLGSRTPIRVVSSAKSWLCHAGVDRRAPILPAEAPEEIEQLSPLEATIRYLEHLRDAWNQRFHDALLAEQVVTLTVPASFDPAARELTAEAAAAAGLDSLVLLEEPQAALYSWIQASEGAWRNQVEVGDLILVIDLGGGTTDLSLIAVTERDGALDLTRVAVGDHILLGGDNMDLALAHVVRAKLAAEGKQLDLWQLQALTHGCRAAKESLLTNPDAESVPVVVPSRGSRLIGGTLRTELTRDEVAGTLVEGFFPLVDSSARPTVRARTALTKLGLPYAQDAAVTRHLAAFLARQLGATADLQGFGVAPEGASFLHPTAVLFNGGVFKAGSLAQRTLQALNAWLEAEGAPQARLLEGADLDLAVARGAAYYGYVRRGQGVRIRGGTAKSYYVGIESAMPAVPGMEPPIEAMCIAPFGMEEGSEADLPPQEVGLVVGEPVRFRFFGSSVRREDRVGTLLEHWAQGELEELEAIEADLPAQDRRPGEVVPVRLQAAVTEVGTLRLDAVSRSGDERWKVELNVRGEVSTIAGKSRPRYLVGIDLGTTHTVVAYKDTRGTADSDIELFEIEQLVAPGEVSARPLLPSLRYHPAPGEIVEGDLTLPWALSDPAGVKPLVIGELARDLGSRVPGRLVASAKSWLSHTEVDRTANILPWGVVEDVPRVSPLDASASYLTYVRDAWNHRFPRNRLEKQEVVLTVPASFDEGARTLTVEAARTAGLTQCRLLEEPQAACYDWIHRHREGLTDALVGVRLLLVIDVGGGTTDLTLIQVAAAGDTPELTRIGVGDHLMLGGDNMDLALAHLLEQRLGGGRLSAAALSQLLQQCRSAKERLLAGDAPDQTTVTVLGSGARLVGGARSATLTRNEVSNLVVDGFFPRVAIEERPHGRRSGIVEFGLPYAPDAAVTRHLAAFLGHHARVSGEALGDAAPDSGGIPVPNAVLLNGGVFHSETLTDRLLGVIEGWRGSALLRLENADPALAVARGAVAYAMARQGKSLRIGGGSARSYFLVVREDDAQRQGVCLLPRGSEEGREVRLTKRAFALRLGEPVSFHLASSTGDGLHRPGDLIDLDEEGVILLPPVATVLGAGDETGEVPVQLGLTPTEVGTLDMGCVAVDDPARRWDLSFQLRRKGAARLEETSHPRFGDATALIERMYGTRTKDVDPKEIRGLRNYLERILGPREDWDTTLLRQLYGELWEGCRRRRRTPHHERFWFSLAGFCLRPGFGYPLDDWRVSQLWSLHAQGVQFNNEAQNWAEWWTLWRRVAGGLDAAAQERLLDDVAGELTRAGTKSKKAAKAARSLSQGDMLRLVGALERLPVQRKVAIGDGLVARLKRKGEPTQTWWTIGRLGARMPLYGGIHCVVPRETAERWLDKTLAVDWRQNREAAFAATMLARNSGDRERDLDSRLQDRVVAALKNAQSPLSWVHMVSELVELDAADEQQAFGESLPPGLRLMG